MTEPIQWIYQAGTGCAYCKDGLCQRMNELMEKGKSIRQGAKIMSEEAKGKWKPGSIDRLFRLYINPNADDYPQKPRQIKDDPEYYTPMKYIEAVREVLEEIDLDPASCEYANKTVKAKIFFSYQDNGLDQDWMGRVFMNPPYGKIGPLFVEKFVAHAKAGHIEGICLVNSGSTETNWFQCLFDGVMCFTDHRPIFDTIADSDNPAPMHGGVFVYFGSNPNKFAETFRQFGNVVKRFG